MKTDYDKYIEQVWRMKEKVFEDFKTSGFATYMEYIHAETKDLIDEIKKKARTKNKSQCTGCGLQI